MFVGGWGPAFLEKRDVGEKYFNYPVLVLFHGISEMVMGTCTCLARCRSSLRWNGDGDALALQVLMFESAPEYGDIRGDTFLLVCP